jgi:hypothetical protein
MFLYEIPCFNVLMWFKNIYDWLSRFVSLYKTKKRPSQKDGLFLFDSRLICFFMFT